MTGISGPQRWWPSGIVAFVLFAPITPARADDPRVGESARRVRVERFHKADVCRTTTQTATVHAFESADLYARAPGYLKAVSVDIGDRVKEGQVLAEVDSPDVLKDLERATAALERSKAVVAVAAARVQAALGEAEAAHLAVAVAQAEAERDAATRQYREKEFARYKDLFDRNAIPENVLNEAQNRFDAARAAERVAGLAVSNAKAGLVVARSRVSEAQAGQAQAQAAVRVAEADRDKAAARIHFTRIAAPFDGVVTRRALHRGAFALPPGAGRDVPVFTVARTDRMRVVTYVLDRDVTWLDRGDPAEVKLDALPGRTFRGKVARCAEAEDPNFRSMRTEIDLDNSDGTLRIGMFGQTTIILDIRSGGTLPATAVIAKKDDGSASCVRVVDGRAALTSIKVGPVEDGRVAVKEGLNEGDAVVVDPRGDRVEEGQRVVGEER